MKLRDLLWWCVGLFVLGIALALPELPRQLGVETGWLVGPGPRAQLLLGPLAALVVVPVSRAVTRTLPPTAHQAGDLAAAGAIGAIAWLEVPIAVRALSAFPAPVMGPRLAGAGAAILAALVAHRGLTQTDETGSVLPTLAGVGSGAALGADFATTPRIAFALAGLALLAALVGMVRGRQADGEPTAAHGP